MSAQTTTPLRPATWWFAAAWLALLLLHLICVGYYVGFAVAYRNLPTSNLAFRFRTYSIGIDEREYIKIAIIHNLVAVIHAVGIVAMLYGSWQQTKLVFYPCNPSFYVCRSVNLTKPSGRVAATDAGPKTSPDPTLASMYWVFSATRDRVRTAIFSRQGLLGVDFAYFDHLLFARELLETSLQSYQAYRMSRLLSRPWLIRSYVALLITNCWIVPIVHRAYSTHDRARRLWSLVGDVVLGVVSSIGISLFLFCIYAQQYTDPRFGFPSINWFSDEWFVSVVQEFQLLVVVSWGDMATRFAFALGLMQSMGCLKDMLDQTHGQTGEAQALVPSQTIAVMPVQNGSATSTEPSSQSANRRGKSIMKVLLHVVGPALFMSWGIAILGIQVYAESQRIDIPCRLPLRPWFSGKPACSLVEVDCYKLNGSIDIEREAWTVFDPTLTAGLVVRHCPKLVVPTSLHLFTGITSMKVYNATIVAWSNESGLSAASHGRLRAVHLVRTNFTGAQLPRGLQRHDFPPTMGSIFMSATNLAMLPVDLHTVWPKRMTISIEMAQFTSVPDVIMRLSPELVSLMGNPIRSLPAELFEITTLRNLFVSYTAIQELPRNVTHLGASLIALFVEGTNVSSFWSWVDPIVERSLPYRKDLFNAYGTPYCRERDQILRGTRQRFSAAMGNQTTDLASIMDVSSPSRLAYVATAVGCTFEFKMLLPLPIQDANSAIR